LPFLINEISGDSINDECSLALTSVDHIYDFSFDFIVHSSFDFIMNHVEPFLSVENTVEGKLWE
jgi:hypothetical protein